MRCKTNTTPMRESSRHTSPRTDYVQQLLSVDAGSDLDPIFCATMLPHFVICIILRASLVSAAQDCTWPRRTPHELTSTSCTIDAPAALQQRRIDRTSTTKTSTNRFERTSGLDAREGEPARCGRLFEGNFLPTSWYGVLL